MNYDNTDANDFANYQIVIPKLNRVLCVSHLEYIPCTCKKISKDLYAVDVDLQVNKGVNITNKIILSMVVEREFLVFEGCETLEDLELDDQVGYVITSVHKDLPDDYGRILIFPDRAQSMCSIYCEDLNILLGKVDLDDF